MSGHGDQETAEELRRKLELTQQALETAQRSMARERRAAIRAVAAKDLELSEARRQLLSAGQAVASADARLEHARGEWSDERKELLQERTVLLHTVRVLHKRLYGPQSEKLDEEKIVELLARLQKDEVPPGAPPPDGSPDWELTKGEGSRKKKPRKGHGRTELPDHLPRIRIEHELEPDERRCRCCGEVMEPFAEEVTSHLEHIPASLHVIDHVRPKYGCRNKSCGEPPKVAPMPPLPIHKGKAGPGMLAHLAVSKFADHLPLDRQRKMLAREGVKIAETTLVGWIAQVADLLRPLYLFLAAQVAMSRIVWTDDTGVPVQDETRDHTRTGRIWVYLGDRDHPYTVYDYTPTRSRDGPVRFLGDFRGYLQADAYAGYDVMFKIDRATEVACWAHARRKFHESLDQEPHRALAALALIRRLYALERHATDKGLTTEQRRELRQDQALPVLTELRAWLDTHEGEVLPKSSLGEAIRYARNQWTALTRYTEDGDLTIDNNASERALRGVAIGRKNWTFLGSDNGGERAAILYTVIESAKQHGLNPHTYLRSLLEYLPGLPDEWVPALAPDRWATTLAAVEVNC